MASHEDFANFETSFAYFESRPHFFLLILKPQLFILELLIIRFCPTPIFR